MDNTTYKNGDLGHGYGIVYPHDKEWNNMFILEHSLLFSEQALFIYSWLQMILLSLFALFLSITHDVNISPLVIQHSYGKSENDHHLRRNMKHTQATIPWENSSRPAGGHF